MTTTAPRVLPPDRVLSVPLRSEVIAIQRETHLAIWSGDDGVVVRPPRAPGFWSATAEGTVAEVAMKRRLSDTSAPPTRWYRLAFDTLRDAQTFARERTKEGYGSYIGDHDRWANRILVERPEFFRQFPMNRPLRFLFVDIEQDTVGTGRFPRSDAPLVSIAISTGDGAPPVVTFAIHADGCAGGEACVCVPDDTPCAEAWRDAIVKGDPDIIIAFNAGYDTTVLSESCARIGFPFTEWGRTLENGERMESYVYTPAGGKGKRSETLYIGGRIVWDLRNNANTTADYNLSGVKDEKLKTIATFLNLPVLKGDVDVKNTRKEWRERPAELAAYNQNDVVLIEHLATRYLPDRMALAEFYGAPLDMALDTGSGWGGTVASARVLFEQGIVADGDNFDRHRDYLRVIREVDEETGEETEKILQFEGAHVELFEAGLHAPLWKVDFASLYPNAILATHIGPDNTRIIGTADLADEPAFRVEREVDPADFMRGAEQGGEAPEVVRIFVPDRKYGHTWIIEVHGESAFTPLLRARMKERLEAKDAGDATRANILKTLLNAMFGVHGAMHNKYGVVAVAIVTTGIGRELARALEGALGAGKVETDTDGIYVKKKPAQALLNRAINKRVAEWGFEPCFGVDVEQYPAGYFHAAKTYLLLTEEGKVKRYGVAMKGKSLPAAFDRVLEDVGGLILRGKRAEAIERARTYLDIDAFDPREFVQRVRLGKSIESYKTATMGVKLALLYEAEFGIPPEPGTSYEYVCVPGAIVPPTPENLARLDKHRYLTKTILRALERCGITTEDLGVERTVARAKVVSKALAKRPKGETNLASFF